MLLPNPECRPIPADDEATGSEKKEECSLGLPKDISILPRLTCPRDSIPAADTADCQAAQRSMRDRFSSFRKVHGEESREWKTALREFTIQCMLHQDTLSKCTFDPFQTTLQGYASLAAQVETDCKMWFRRHLGEGDTAVWWELVEELGGWLVNHDCDVTPFPEKHDDLSSDDSSVMSLDAFGRIDTGSPALPLSPESPDDSEVE